MLGCAVIIMGKNKKYLEMMNEIEEPVTKKHIWSHNPYWYAKGYVEYFLPMLLS
jgi:hypothetical protein